MKAWKIAVATVLAVVLLCIPFIHCDALIAAPLRLSGLVGGGIDDGTYVVGDDFHSPLNAGDYIFVFDGGRMYVLLGHNGYASVESHMVLEYRVIGDRMLVSFVDLVVYETEEYLSLDESEREAQIKNRDFEIRLFVQKMNGASVKEISNGVSVCGIRMIRVSN